MSYESWRISYQSGEQAARAAYERGIALAAKVIEMKAEIAALKLYSPCRRPQTSPRPVPIAPTNWAFWGMIDETDEQFAARAGRRVIE